jgi:hypothetical protein
VHSFLIGTDGVLDLIRQQDDYLPGTNVAIGPVDGLWTHDHYYANTQAVSNRLRLTNTDQTRIDWQGHKKSTDWGRLPDDTTLVVGRRIAGGVQVGPGLQPEGFPLEEGL